MHSGRSKEKRRVLIEFQERKWWISVLKEDSVGLTHNLSTGICISGKGSRRSGSKNPDRSGAHEQYAALCPGCEDVKTVGKMGKTKFKRKEVLAGGDDDAKERYIQA